MALVVKGSQGFTEQPKKRKWTPEGGWVTEREWHGPNTDSVVRAQEEAVKALGAESISTDTGIPAIITASFSDNNNGGITVVDPDLSERNAVWELIPMQIDKLIETHPEIEASTGVEMAKAQKLIKEGKADDTLFNNAPFKTYLKLKMAGVDTYLIWTFTIRKTYSTTKASAKQLTFDNVGSCQEYNRIGVPASVKWQNIGTWVPSGALGSQAFTWVSFQSSVPQWYENPPVIRWNERTKQYDITREWLGAEAWSKNFYYNGTNDP